MMTTSELMEKPRPNRHRPMSPALAVRRSEATADDIAEDVAAAAATYERMLDNHGGNVTRAAESAGVARRYFQILKARVAKKTSSSPDGGVT